MLLSFIGLLGALFFLKKNQRDKDWKKSLKRNRALVQVAILAEKGDGLFDAVKVVPFL